MKYLKTFIFLSALIFSSCAQLPVFIVRNDSGEAISAASTFKEDFKNFKFVEADSAFTVRGHGNSILVISNEGKYLFDKVIYPKLDKENHFKNKELLEKQNAIEIGFSEIRIFLSFGEDHKLYLCNVKTKQRLENQLPPFPLSPTRAEERAATPPAP